MSSKYLAPLVAALLLTVTVLVLRASLLSEHPAAPAGAPGGTPRKIVQTPPSPPQAPAAPEASTPVSRSEPPTVSDGKDPSAGGPSEPEKPDLSWRSSLQSPDPGERAGAVSRIPDLPAEGDAGLLDGIIDFDPDPGVRERAVLAYGDLLGQKAADRLREIALKETDPIVNGAAMAALHRVRNESPEPPRGWIQAEVNGQITAGEPFLVGFRFGSSAPVPRATLRLVLPPGTESVDPEPPIWRDSLAAGQLQERTFRVRLTAASVRVRLRAYLTLDYEPMLDAEVHELGIRIQAEGGVGGVEILPPAVRR